jgi:hypothetical protein
MSFRQPPESIRAKAVTALFLAKQAALSQRKELLSLLDTFPRELVWSWGREWRSALGNERMVRGAKILALLRTSEAGKSVPLPPEIRKVADLIREKDRRERLISDFRFVTQNFEEPSNLHAVGMANSAVIHAIKALCSSAVNNTLSMRKADAYARNQALENIAVLQADVEDTLGALKTLRHLEHDDLRDSRVNGLEAVAQRQATAGNSTATRQILSEAIRLVQKSHDEKERAGLLGLVGWMHAILGSTERAKRAFEEATELVRRLDDQGDTDFACIQLCACQARAGMSNGALETMRLIQSSQLQSSIFRIIAKHQAKMGFYAEAMDTAELGAIDRDDVLIDLARHFAEQGQLKELKTMVIPCSKHLKAAYRICTLLAKFCPQQRSRILDEIQSRAELFGPAQVSGPT